MDYHQACVTTGACHHAVYATNSQGHAQHVWTAIPQYQYGYVQHTAMPPVDHTYAQVPVMSPIDVTSGKPTDNRNGLVAIPPGQPMGYSNDGEVDYGQSLSPTVEFNVEELLEYQRRRSSASTDEKEPLTPAQRRRKAQNRAAQRAFRDRKRQRVQDLEAQLSALEVRTNSLETDNERLKQELLLSQNENDVLRSITRTHTSSSTLQHDRRRKVTEEDGLGQHLPSRT